jgi:hypothetical protein
VLIGFVGDVHGQVFHALAAVASWQAHAGRRLDVLIQLGDMGAEPDGDRQEATPSDPYAGDFARLLKAEGPDRHRAG